MDRNIITKADVAQQESAAVRKWIPILQSILNNSQHNLGSCLRAQDANTAEYWRGSIDTILHILMLIEKIEATE